MNRRFTAPGSYDTCITVTSPTDIGSLTADILLTDLNKPSSPIYIASDTVTYGQVYDLLTSQGWGMSKNVVMVEELRQTVESGEEDKFAKYRLVFAKGKGTSWEMSRTWNGKRGSKVESLEEWMTKNLPRPA